MTRLFANQVASVDNPRTIVLLLPEEQSGWCQQYAEEGYNVLHVQVKDGVVQDDPETFEHLIPPRTPWALLTYGLDGGGFEKLARLSASTANVRACIHYCPLVEDADALILHNMESGTGLPILVHLAASQESLRTALVAKKGSYDTTGFPLVDVYTYPDVAASPPFPFAMKPPALVQPEEMSSVDPHIRSATGMAYTRTLRVLRRELGPQFDLEQLWEQHTYLEFAERNAPKTMATMVRTPYVNHIPTLTGGVGYEDLARFYKGVAETQGDYVAVTEPSSQYHFTTVKVTPPDTEMITISRTVGADRLIDEMIFKCTHTTEIDWLVPGIAPTGKRLEIALVGVVAFRGDKLTFEHIYWDQASVLVQLGLLDPKLLPVAGVEAARKAMDPFSIPSNGMMARWKESHGLDIN